MTQFSLFLSSYICFINIFPNIKVVYGANEFMNETNGSIVQLFIYKIWSAILSIRRFSFSLKILLLTIIIDNFHWCTWLFIIFSRTFDVRGFCQRNILNWSVFFSVILRGNVWRKYAWNGIESQRTGILMLRPEIPFPRHYIFARHNVIGVRTGGGWAGGGPRLPNNLRGGGGQHTLWPPQ